MTATQPRHADAELTIASNAKPPSAAKQNRDKKNADLVAAANQMRERAAAAATEPAEAAAPTPPPREDVESIEIELLDKRKVVIGPPPGVSLTMRIAMVIPEAVTNPVVDKLARLCMSIRTIDGKPARQIGSIVDLTALANSIGDVGIDELNFWYDKHWGTLKVSDLQLLKKNLR